MPQKVSKDYNRVIISLYEREIQEVAEEALGRILDPDELEKLSNEFQMFFDWEENLKIALDDMFGDY